MNDNARDKSDRAARLAYELRANLAKRKAQARSRRIGEVADGRSGTTGEESATRADIAHDENAGRKILADTPSIDTGSGGAAGAPVED